MKNIYVLVFPLILILHSKYIHSIEIDIKKDLILLKKNDQDFFLKNCEKNKVILETGECLNFLGIKLFLVGYRNKNISESDHLTSYENNNQFNVIRENDSEIQMEPTSIEWS